MQFLSPCDGGKPIPAYPTPWFIPVMEASEEPGEFQALRGVARVIITVS